VTSQALDEVAAGPASAFPPTLQARLYRRILIAVDSSDHADAAVRDGAAIAALADGAVVTGTHVYAARLHDMRFRQMEGGLPEPFREEPELERQREVHDDLITRGLSIITDSYLDQAESQCRSHGLEFRRRSLEGKNYRELAREANSGSHDLLVLGAQGLGAIRGHRIGTVCRRVARRAAIDTLVVKDPARPIAHGPIAVALDGSTRSYGGLLTALALAQRWQVPVRAVAAFDPYYHYVAFRRIAGVLSEQAGRVFRFREQEKLHEEIIDSGLAKIYEGHLAVARSIGADFGVEIGTELLAGKPHDAIEAFVREAKPSLLVVGKLGIHADDELDIGGNAEQLLEDVGCAVLLGTREHQPALDVVASVTTSWTREAEARIERVPSFVRNMARMAILRYAQERGHTVITERIVEEATAQLMPGHAERALGEIVAAHAAGELTRAPAADDALRWSPDAVALLRGVEDLAVRGTLSMRAEKKARQEGSSSVEAAHVRPFLQARPHWHAAALARLMRVPQGFMRDRSRETIERHASENGHAEITLEVAEAGLALARGRCPFGAGGRAGS
jgi:nucleotide-binding universal stress UspA family protein